MKKVMYVMMFCVVIATSYSVLIGFGEDDMSSVTNLSKSLSEEDMPSLMNDTLEDDIGQEDDMGQLHQIDMDNSENTELFDSMPTDNQPDLKLSEIMPNRFQSAEDDSMQDLASEISDDAMEDENIASGRMIPEPTTPTFRQEIDPVLSSQWVGSDDNNDFSITNYAELGSDISQDMPKLTTRDLQESVEMNEKISETYKELADNLQKVWAALQGSELGKSVNIVELTQLLHNAQATHKNVASVFEVMLTIQKLGYQLGEKLQSELQAKAEELSKKAQEASEKATEEMERSLGLKPVINM